MLLGPCQALRGPEGSAIAAIFLPMVIATAMAEIVLNGIHEVLRNQEQPVPLPALDLARSLRRPRLLPDEAERIYVLRHYRLFAEARLVRL